jgi:PTH1 family peptidyl-tRNA hydrolase
MLLFVGLGNPGPRHQDNRHNFGFRALEAIHARHRFGPWRRRFHGLTAEGEIGGMRVLLLLPLTYMNDSGRAVAEAAHFYKLPLGQVTVFHDELDLQPLKVRVKTGGGNAGHNGLRSVSAMCGNDYQRVRLGVGHPGDRELVYPYLLSDFAKADRAWVAAVCEAVADAAEFLAAGRPEEFQNRVHLALAAKALTPPERPNAPDKPAA